MSMYDKNHYNIVISLQLIINEKNLFMIIKFILQHLNSNKFQ